MEIETKRLAMHVAEIGHRFHIRVILDETLPPHMAGAFPDGSLFKMTPQLRAAWPTQPTVFGKPVKDETSYAVIMHEYGHLLHPTGVLRTGKDWELNKDWTPRQVLRWINLSMLEEVSAWEWARTNALYWSVAMQQTEALCFRSYQQRKERLEWLTDLSK